MKLFVLSVFLLPVAFGQTRLISTQVNWSRINPSFFQTPCFAADGSVNGKQYSMFNVGLQVTPLPNSILAPPLASKNPPTKPVQAAIGVPVVSANIIPSGASQPIATVGNGTYLTMDQLSTMGVSVSSDKTVLYVETPYNNGLNRIEVRLKNPAATGSIELRYGNWTPNFNFVGMLSDDVTISMAFGNSAMMNNQVYPKFPLVTIGLSNGQFTIGNIVRYTNNCQQWN